MEGDSKNLKRMNLFLGWCIKELNTRYDSEDEEFLDELFGIKIGNFPEWYNNKAENLITEIPEKIKACTIGEIADLLITDKIEEFLKEEK